MLAAAKRRAKREEATINDILLAAYYRAYASMEGPGAANPVSIVFMMDLRRYCRNGESEGLANLSGSMPLSGMEGMPLLHKKVLLELLQKLGKEIEEYAQE